jgi:hypothetical protein
MIWFRKARPSRRQALSRGQYAEGRGVPQDYVRAYMWFSLSAAQGEQRAVKTLSMAERKMTPAQIAEGQARTRLEAGYEANSSLKECALRPCNQTTPRGQLRLETPWHRRPHRQLTKILLVMARLSLI